MAAGRSRVGRGQLAGGAERHLITSTATLGTFNAGDAISIRFLAAYDECSTGSNPNWVVDNVAFTCPIVTTSTSSSSTSTTSTTSTTVLSAACPPAPDPSCIDVTTSGTRFIVSESSPGTESLVLRTGRSSVQMATALGDPTVGGGTSYGICVYRDGGALVQQYTVARAGDTCGARACWRVLGPPRGGPPTNGYRYMDRARTEDGIRILELQAAPRSRVSIRGRNGAGSSNLPLGVTAGLAGATSATVQVRGSDAPACLSIELTNVWRSTATAFVGTAGGP